MELLTRAGQIWIHSRPDPELLDPAGFGSTPDPETLDQTESGSTKSTVYPVGSGSGPVHLYSLLASLHNCTNFY